MSVELGTTDQDSVITHARNLVLAGSRLYAIWSDGFDLVYQYSDDGSASWSSKTVVSADQGARPTAFYDSVNGRLNFVYAGDNSAASSLRMRAITSNVTSGSPGALTSETVIDAGGADAGVVFPHALHTPTGGNPRYWIIAMKVTGAAAFETRVWYAAAGSAADTAGNWSTTNFTNLGSNSSANSDHLGMGAYWTISGNPRLTFVFEDGETNSGTATTYEAVTFDPAAASPTPGSVTVISASQGAAGTPNRFADSSHMALNAKTDYLVFGRLDDDASGVWDFFKTVNGTSWSEPSGWSGLTMGRAQIALSGSDFLVLHTDSWGPLASSAQQLRYRTITTSSDAMSSAVAYSSTPGNGVCTLLDTGTTNLYALYRGSTAAPYSVRSDVLAISAPPPAVGAAKNMLLLGVG